MERVNTKRINLGKNTIIGGQNKVLIQSMCNIKTSFSTKIIDQINECAHYGADLMRVSILDDKDLDSIKEIMDSIEIPLVADIHYNYHFAIDAINKGVNKIRINPGNLNNLNEYLEILNTAKKQNTAIRIGVNAGSLKNDNKLKVSDLLVNKALEYLHFAEEHDFYNLVLSLKTSNPLETIEAYTKISNLVNYPLHIGLTESGFDEIGIIRSIATLSPLLLKGIGDTIRISLTSDPIKEIMTCKRLLHDIGLYKNYPTLISCPTCGRTEVNIKPLAKKVLNYLEDNSINLKVAVMGCPVNGIGEGKDADIGLAGGKEKYLLFKKGQLIKTVDEENAFNALVSEINSMIKN